MYPRVNGSTENLFNSKWLIPSRTNGQEVHMWSIIGIIAASILALFVCIHMLDKEKTK